MPETNGTIIKTIASAGATAIIGVLFYYFLQAHFTYLKESNNLIMKSIETQVKLIETVERLDRTISTKTGKLDLQSAFKNAH